jgi:hypothetical protein
MASSPSFYSKIDKGIYELLAQRAGNNDPKQLGGVSGLRPWVRIISAAKQENDRGDGDSGLVLDSYDGVGSFESRYGTRNSPGILGYKLDLQTPVRTDQDGRGLRPRPLLTDLSVSEFMDGKRQVKFEIVCYTLEQIDTISKYLAEVRFNLLIEWGWNTSDSRRALVSDGREIELCDIISYDKFPTIQKKRRKSNYQYDAAFVRIQSFDISFGENETFKLSVDCLGLGSVAKYLQLGRGETSTNKSTIESTKRFPEPAIESFSDKDEIGKVLFAQFFNALPNQKRTPQVKDLINDTKITDPANYINIDKVISDQLTTDASTARNLNTDSGTLKVPNDYDLKDAFSTKKYVRFEVLAKVLNTLQQEIDEFKPCRCGNQSRKRNAISINNTIIRAFPYMFSTDSDILYIPNTEAPNFSLARIVNSVDKESYNFFDINNLLDQPVNLHPMVGTNSYKSGTREARNGQQTPYAFPATYDLSPQDNPVNTIDETFIPFECPQGFWGYLKDLYINLDFFNQTFTKSNYTSRDIWYELLNGISSACGNLWNFKIHEDTADNDTSYSRIYDEGFTGRPNLSNTEEYEVPIQSRGLDSPFQSFEFKTDTPQSLITSKLMTESGDTDTQTDQNDPNPELMNGSLFSETSSDQTFLYLYTSDTEPTTQQNNVIENEEESQNILLEYFNGKASILPTINNRNLEFDLKKGFFDRGRFAENDTPIENIMVTGIFEDPNLLAFIKRGIYNTTDDVKKKFRINDDEVRKINPPIGMSSVTFTVHGIGGFKIGDLINFGGLPRKFSENFIFFITDISHSINDSSWTTNVTCKSMINFKTR